MRKKFKDFKKKIWRGINHNSPTKKRQGTLKNFETDLGALEPIQWGGGRRKKSTFGKTQKNEKMSKNKSF